MTSGFVIRREAQRADIARHRSSRHDYTGANSTFSVSTEPAASPVAALDRAGAGASTPTLIVDYGADVRPLLRERATRDPAGTVRAQAIESLIVDRPTQNRETSSPIAPRGIQTAMSAGTALHALATQWPRQSATRDLLLWRAAADSDPLARRQSIEALKSASPITAC